MTSAGRYLDVEYAVTGHLRGLLEVPVVTRVPDPRPSVFVQVRRVGGVAELVWDRPRLDVFAWAADDETAHDLGMAARAALHDLQGTSALGVPCYQVAEVLGPRRADDEATGLPRIWLTVDLSLRIR